jgi:serine/threonine protein kinase/tetratricopeptide (TPR) repeat protein
MAAADDATQDFVKPVQNRYGSTTVDASMVGAAFSPSDPTAGTDGPARHSVAGYDILELLGRGAMGVVYKALQRSLKRIVALKMVLAGGQASTSELARFRIEAEAVAQLQHPNIVQIYDVGEQDSHPYLALEYIDGGSLHAKISGTPQPLLHAAQLVHVLALAMNFAHRLGIIHRDLKPANVMLSLAKMSNNLESAQSQAPLVEQLYGTPKIADFGLAKRLAEDGGQTRSGTILGTPSYMAPEQADGNSSSVGPLADQYSLGAILYELLTGRPPFRSESVWDLLQQVRTREPVPPSHLRPKVPRDLETVCLKALQKEPSKRYAHCAALAEDLRRFVAGEPIVARPIGNAERLWRWCRRNPKIAALTAAVFGLLVAVIVILVGFTMRLAREKADKELALEQAVQQEKQARSAEKTAGDTGAIEQDLLRSMLSEVHELARDIPGSVDLQEEVTRLAMDGSERISRITAGEHDFRAHPDLGRIRLKAIEQLGSLLYNKNPEEAARNYEQAYALAKQLAEAQPESDKAQSNLAAMLLTLGQLRLSKGDLTAARRYFIDALNIRIQIHDHPQSKDLTEVERKLMLAYTYPWLCQLEQANPYEERRLNRLALTLQRQAVALEPENREALQSLAVTCLGLGGISEKLHQLAEAGDYYREAVQVYDRIDPAILKKRVVRRMRARAGVSLGETLLRLRQPGAARTHYELAVEVYKTQYEEEPRNGGLRYSLFNAYYGLGTAAAGSGATDVAADSFKQAIALNEPRLRDPKDVGARLEIMLCRARLGQYQEAAQLAEQARRLAPRDGLKEIAAGYALCIPAVIKGRELSRLTPTERQLTEEYAAKALAALTQARSQGLKDWVSLETEPDLAPLKGRPDFESFLEELRRAYPLPKPPSS